MASSRVRLSSGLLLLAAWLGAAAVGGCGGGTTPAPTSPSPASGLNAAAYLTIETGALPVVLSAPHGGTIAVPGVPVRQTGTTVLDTNTYQLASAIQSALAARTGKRAHLVAALVSRSYVDFNRASAEAYETASVAPLYVAYHAALQQAAQAALAQSSAGAILVDIHGQGTDATTVFRGTRDGQTASLATLCTPEGGFLARLVAQGVLVDPPGLGGTEASSYNGGYIVATYGRSMPAGVNAVQLEFGMDYRQSGAIVTTAARIVDALVEHLRVHAPGSF